MSEIISAILAIEKSVPPLSRTIAAVFLLNGLLNLGWTFLFFRKRLMLTALFDCAAIELSLAWLYIAILPVSPLAAFLLLPYFFWMLFASYLNYTVYKLNHAA